MSSEDKKLDINQEVVETQDLDNNQGDLVTDESHSKAKKDKKGKNKKDNSENNDKDKKDDSENNDKDKNDKNGNKSDSNLDKNWEASIISNKRVRLEEGRRTWKKILISIIVCSIILTSSVYMMLLFIESNNIRITAINKTDDVSVALSNDNVTWTPFLDAQGPDTMWNVTYDPSYPQEIVRGKKEALEFVNAKGDIMGDISGENYIAFMFMVRNNTPTKESIYIEYDMSITHDDIGLEKAVRILWAESFSHDIENTKSSANVYAMTSTNPKLAGLETNAGRPNTSYIEKIAYPLGSDGAMADLSEYEDWLNNPETNFDGGITSDEYKYIHGFEDTIPFESSMTVFSKGRDSQKVILQAGEMMYVYCSVWLEGSDFDCTDDKLGGYLSLGIDFVARKA